MRLRGWNIAWLLLLGPMLVAGCADETDRSDARDGTPAAPPLAGPLPIAPDARPVLFPTATNETHWWNGTFEGHENQQTVGDVSEEVGVDAGAHHRYDVSDLLPRDTLLSVAIEIEADLAEGDLDLWLDLPDTAQRSIAQDTPYGGWSRLEYALIRTDDVPIGLIVRHDEMEPTAFAYTVHMEVAGMPEHLPDGIAVRVQLAASDVLDIVPDAEGAADVIVWGPDGTYLGRLPVQNGTVRIEAAAWQGVGVYTVLRTQGPGGARLYVTGSERIETAFPALRWERSEEHTADGPIEWTWETVEMPVAIGLAFRIGAPQTGDLSATVTGPEGRLLTWEDATTFVIGYGVTLMTPRGAAGVMPGAYAFQVIPGTTAPTEPTRAQRLTAYLDLA